MTLKEIKNKIEFREIENDFGSYTKTLQARLIITFSINYQSGPGGEHKDVIKLAKEELTKSILYELYNYRHRNEICEKFMELQTINPIEISKQRQKMDEIIKLFTFFPPL